MCAVCIVAGTDVAKAGPATGVATEAIDIYMLQPCQQGRYVYVANSTGRSEIWDKFHEL